MHINYKICSDFFFFSIHISISAWYFFSLNHIYQPYTSYTKTKLSYKRRTSRNYWPRAHALLERLIQQVAIYFFIFFFKWKLFFSALVSCVKYSIYFFHCVIQVKIKKKTILACIVRWHWRCKAFSFFAIAAIVVKTFQI